MTPAAVTITVVCGKLLTGQKNATQTTLEMCQALVPSRPGIKYPVMGNPSLRHRSPASADRSEGWGGANTSRWERGGDLGRGAPDNKKATDIGKSNKKREFVQKTTRRNRNLPKGARATRATLEMCQTPVPSRPEMKYPVRGNPSLRHRSPASADRSEGWGGVNTSRWE